jgi:hypothetical protein
VPRVELLDLGEALQVLLRLPLALQDVDFLVGQLRLVLRPGMGLPERRQVAPGDVEVAEVVDQVVGELDVLRAQIGERSPRQRGSARRIKRIPAGPETAAQAGRVHAVRFMVFKGFGVTGITSEPSSLLRC